MDKETAHIRLDQLLKLKGLVESGGHAKMVIQSGEVMLNGATETRRGKKLIAGDEVTFEGQKIHVEAADIRE